jgi:hypothetical protein
MPPFPFDTLADRFGLTPFVTIGQLRELEASKATLAQRAAEKRGAQAAPAAAPYPYQKHGFGPPPPDPLLCLLARDPGVKDIWLQYCPGEVKEDGGAVWAEGGGFSRQHPILAWARGELQVFTFETVVNAPSRLFGTHEEMWEFVEQVKAAKEPIPDLGRPPIFTFQWGDLSFDKVIVASVGGIRYSRMQETASGSRYPYFVYFSVALKHFEPFSFDRSEPGKPPHQTMYIVARDQHWEHFARRVYGDPSLGEILRRQNPGDSSPVSGKTYRCLEKAQIQGELIQPRSVPLARTPEAFAFRSALFDARAKQHHIPGLGLG